jgi:hypothetical protein
VADGWSYLGKAILAMLRGDPHRCRHFGYYSELRAAMSLSASHGIGVFDKKHVVIDAPNSVALLTGNYGTHQFAWDCLDAWSTQPSSGRLFAKVISPSGITLDDWFAPLGGAAAVAPQAERWFQQWGMDLKAGLDDRNARNESSYRPDGIPVPWYIEGNDVIEFVRELWSLLEPTVESRFDAIDRHIVRIALERFFKGSSGKTPAAAPKKFRELIERILVPLSLSAEAKKLWEEFLSRKVFRLDPLPFNLSRESPKTESWGYASIVSRASLLLRLASGATSSLLLASGLTADLTLFWWNNLGVARGLWDGSKDPTDLVDLWADIDLLLNDLEKFQQKYPAKSQSFGLVGSELAASIVGLGSCERVAIWSMTPSI